jgi:cyclase
MNKIRIIPTILYKDSSAIKGKGFKSWRIVGSLKQTIRLYSIREVDELIFLDIEATKKNKINFDLIDEFADECFMPITVGGGIKCMKDIEDLFKVGADRVCINSYVFKSPNFIKDAIKIFGSQCIVVSVDYKLINKKNIVFIESGSKNTNIELYEYLKELELMGVREIILTSIDRDGTMKGYDIENIKKINNELNFKVIASGGAGNKHDVLDVIKKTNVKSVSCSSVFHFTELTPLTLKSFLKQNNLNIRI